MNNLQGLEQEPEPGSEEAELEFESELNPNFSVESNILLQSGSEHSAVKSLPILLTLCPEHSSEISSPVKVKEYSYSITFDTKRFEKEIDRMSSINFKISEDTRKRVVWDRDLGWRSPYLLSLEGGLLKVIQCISEQYPFFALYELRARKGGGINRSKYCQEHGHQN